MREALPTGRVLEVIRGRTEAPGSLVRTGPPAAPWVYLLPRLRFERIAIVGHAERRMLDTLSRRCSELHAAGTEPVGAEDLLVAMPRRRPYGPGARRRLARMVSSTAHAGGVAYVETVARPGRAPFDVAAPTRSEYLVAPLGGPASSLAPVDTPTLAAWLASSGLTGGLGTTRWAIETAHRLRAMARATLGRSGATGTATRAAATRAGGRGRRLTRRVAGGVVGTLVRAERTWDRLTGLERRATIYGAPSGVPAWLVDVARPSGTDLDGYRAALAAPGEFPTQKILLALLPAGAPEPTIIVKLGDHPAVRPRIDAAVAAMEVLAERRLVPSGSVPRVVFNGSVHGVRLMAEEAAPGPRLDRATTARADCRWARAVVDWIVELGGATRREVSGEALAEALDEILDRLRAANALERGELAFLHALVADLRATPWVPAVVQHGDPGPWNIHVDPARDAIAVLDWENAEPTGIPLWDLAYFLRSFGTLVARRAGVEDRLDRGTYVLTAPDMRELAAEAMGRYAARVELPTSLVRPLYYHHWAYQALKESTRLPATQVRHGIFLRTLRWLIDRRDDPAIGTVLGVRA